ncbi:FliM/FliN family flagellar motor C-terminal domain-containing protein [Paracidobacterium acidisoli]|nr:FliM/FliN family flagellar motor C-terminal domain-containing protein [Paracidobacterium acidisoli]MBT9330297.1 FliM/FliN family flagellar motor C-terminal domain-containing protein [Paracidobacterium acidisoli]
MPPDAEIPATPTVASQEHAGPAPLVPTESATAAKDPLSPESVLSRLPVQMDVLVPVPGFRVEDLLALEKGRVLETVWASGDDLPVRGGGVQLVWSEFEVVEQKLAVRVTRLV